MEQQNSYWQSNFRREGEPEYTPTQDERTLAILVHAFGIFFWIIPPLVVYLWKKDQSPYLAAHAKEALNFQISIAIWGVLLFISMIGILFLWIPGLLDLIFCIVAALRASENRFFRYPLTLRLIK